MKYGVAAAMLLVTCLTAAADPLTPVVGQGASERPNIVLASIGGMMSSDSSEVSALTAAFRQAFDADFYLTEGMTGGPPRISRGLGNRFRLVHGDPFGDEWQVRVGVMGWLRREEDGGAGGHLPQSRTGRSDSTGTGWPVAGSRPRDPTWGIHVDVVILSPEAAQSGLPPVRVTEKISFRIPFEPGAARVSSAGRAAGLLAVEALHRCSGDLEPDVRVRLDGTVRSPIVDRVPPAPRR